VHDEALDYQSLIAPAPLPLNYLVIRMFFKKIRTMLHVYKIIDSGVNSRYTIKISSNTGTPRDNNSDAKAKNEVVRMVLAGEINRDDARKICGTYMTARESILMQDGQFTRWADKFE